MLWDIYKIEIDEETLEETRIFVETYNYEPPAATPYGRCIELHYTVGGDYVAVIHPEG